VDRQFWRIYDDKRDTSPKPYHCLTVANGQRQRRFRSRLANRHCPDILRATHTYLDANSNSAFSNADNHCHIYPDSSGNSHTYSNIISNVNADSHSDCYAHEQAQPYANSYSYAYSQANTYFPSERNT
jgi:hypothetical protein